MNQAKIHAAQEAYLGQLKGVHTAAQIVGDDTRGGVLAPPKYETRLVRKLGEWAPIPAHCSVQMGTMSSIRVPVQDSVLTASWRDEGQSTPSPGDVQVGSVDIPAPELTAITHASREALGDPFLDMQALILSEQAASFGRAEGKAILVGNGTNQPTGVLSNKARAADISTTDIGTSSFGVTWAKLIEGQYALNSNYARGAIWVMKRETVGAIRALTDSDGRFDMWTPSLTKMAENLILSHRYVECEDMPATGTDGNKAIIFGDFRRGYRVYDRMGLSVLTDPYSSKGTGMVEFTSWRRCGGNVLRADAFRIFTV